MGISQKEIIEKLFSEAQSHIEKYTYPVFINSENGRPNLIASSVILELDSKIYFVTASHAIEEWKKSKGPLYLGAKNEFIEISGQGKRTIDSEGDHVDIAFIELRGNILEKVAYVSPNYLLLKNIPSKGSLFFVHGYPISKNKQAKAMKGSSTFNSYAFAHASKVLHEFAYWGEFNKSAEIHYCMSYGESFDLNGDPIKPLHPRGLSGGGFWFVPELTKPENVYLAGIFIEYYEKQKVSFATKIEQLVHLIKNVT